MQVFVNLPREQVILRNQAPAAHLKSGHFCVGAGRACPPASAAMAQSCKWTRVLQRVSP